jgi:general secretion pathway protein A
MYEEFYGLRDNPFRLTPDPDYLFLSTNHQEALGHLLFGISERSGVVVITGEIGAGKTTLLRTFVRDLDAQTIVAYIFNPALSALELLQTINTELGLPATSTSKKELIDELNRFLLDEQAAGRRVVVIVDEAQNLEPGVLEQLRLLSNLETEREKLLQIILVGQPELRAILARPELTQLDQRVTLRWHLGPLNAGETGAYVRHRIRRAAAMREAVHFTPAASRLIHRFSHGIPRLINILCHRALLIGFTREEREIGRKIIRQAIQELRRDQQKPSFSWRPVAVTTLGIMSILFVAGAFFGVVPSRDWLPRVTSPNRQEATAQVPAVQRVEAQGSSSQSASSKPADAQAALAPPTPAPNSASLTTASPSTAEGTTTTDTFVQDLQGIDLVDSAVRSTTGLLRAWGVDELQAEEWRNGALDLNAIARARHLEYIPLSGTVNLLSLLDLPVILEMTASTVRQEARFVLLLGVTGDRCRVLLGHEREVPMREVTEHWLGKAHLFWKDFENVGFLLALGSVGQNVKRLHTLLSKVQGPDDGKFLPPRLDTFGRQTEAAVTRFQKAKRLPSDGVVGPLTLVLLYNSLTNYSHPNLGTMGNPPIGENPGSIGRAAQGKSARKMPLIKERT